MIDRYTKTILTVIAVSLAALAVEQATPTAHAQGVGCGDSAVNPCYIAAQLPLHVFVENPS